MPKLRISGAVGVDALFYKHSSCQQRQIYIFYVINSIRCPHEMKSTVAVAKPALTKNKIFSPAN
jgi:hypothetical protein